MPRFADNSAAQTLPFEKVKHQVATLDAQPASESGNILVLVTGALLVCHHSRTLSLVAQRTSWPKEKLFYD